MKLSRSAIAAIALLIVLLLAVPTTAAALSRAAAQSVVPATTAAWGAVAVPGGAEASRRGALSVKWDGAFTTSEYFDIVNVGTLPLSTQAMAVRTVSWANGRIYPSMTMTACTGGSWSSGRCPSGEVHLGTTNRGNFTSSVVLQPGERLAVRFDNTLSLTSGTSTIDVSVSRAQVRAGAVTNN